MPAAPSACTVPSETCNEIDDDCDGLIDGGIMSAGPPLLLSTGADFGRPRAANTRDYIWGIWTIAGRNWLRRMNRDGTDGSAAVALDSASIYDVGAQPRTNVVVYASVDGAGDIHVHRFADDPRYGALYRWSQTIASDAVEVHVVVGTDVWVYSRNAAGRVQFHTLDMYTGTLAGAPTYVVYSDMRVSAWSNGYRLHLVATSVGDAIYWRLYDSMLGRIGFGSFPAPAARLRDFVVTGDSRVVTAGPITYDGFLIAYAMDAGSGQPAEVRYYSRRESGVAIDQRIVANPITVATAHPQMDLAMADGIAHLGVVLSTSAGNAAGIPRVYQLSKRAGTGAEYNVRGINLGLPSAVHQGISVIRFEDAFGPSPDRFVYDPGGDAIASIPIGCF
jgi:hypothetical protein